MAPGFGLWLRLCALNRYGWRRQVGRQRLIGQLEDFRKQVRLPALPQPHRRCEHSHLPGSQLEALCADAQWVCLKPLHTPLRVYVAHALRIASHMPFADNAPDVVPADESTYEPSDAVRAHSPLQHLLSVYARGRHDSRYVTASARRPGVWVECLLCTVGSVEL